MITTKKSSSSSQQPVSAFLKKFASKISVVQKDGNHTTQAQPVYDKPYYKLAPAEIIKSAEAQRIQEENELYELAARQEPSEIKHQPVSLQQHQDYSDDSDTDRDFDNHGNDEDTDYAIDALENALKLLSPKLLRKQQTLLSSIRSWDDQGDPQENEEEELVHSQPIMRKQKSLITQSQPNISTYSSQESIAPSAGSKSFKPRPPVNPRPSKLPPRQNRYCKYSPETIRKLTTAPEPAQPEYFLTPDGYYVYQDEHGNFVPVQNTGMITQSMSNINQTNGSYVDVFNKKSKPVEKELMSKIKHSLTMKQYADKVRVTNRFNEISKGTTLSKSKGSLEKRRDPNEIRKEIENERLKRRIEYGNRVTVAPKRPSISSDPDIMADQLPEHLMKHRSADPSTPRFTRKQAITNRDDFEALEADYMAKKEKVDAIRRQFFLQSLNTTIN